MKKKSITTSEFDQRFEANEDLTQYLDLSNAVRQGNEPRRVSVDFPGWMVDELDRVSKRLVY